jgi:hypothetical protein
LLAVAGQLYLALVAIRPTAVEPSAAAGDDDAPFADGGSRGSHEKALPEVDGATTVESVQ